MPEHPEEIQNPSAASEPLVVSWICFIINVLDSTEELVCNIEVVSNTGKDRGV